MSAPGTATVAIWSMTSGSQVDRLEHHAPARAITFSSDGLRRSLLALRTTAVLW
jgi:hypothetical protein